MEKEITTNYEIKKINGRNYRVNKKIDIKFFKEDFSKKDEFRQIEENDDVDSFSGDSHFLYESEEEQSENEEEES